MQLFKKKKSSEGAVQMAEYGKRLSRWLVGGHDDEEIPEKDFSLRELMSPEDLVDIKKCNTFTFTKNELLASRTSDIRRAPFQTLIITDGNSEVLGSIPFSFLAAKVLDNAPSNASERCCDKGCAVRKFSAVDVTNDSLLPSLTMDAKVGEVRQVMKVKNAYAIVIISENENKEIGLLPMELLARKLVDKRLEYIQKEDPVIQRIEEWVRNHPAADERFLPVGEQLYSPKEVLEEVKKDSQISRELRNRMAELI